MTIEAVTTTEERLDRMSAQLEALVAEMEFQRARRQRYEELFHEMSPIARQAIDTATTELQEVDVTVEDIVSFAKMAADSLPFIEGSLRTLRSVTELGSALMELSEPGTEFIVDKMDEYEQKGYFGFVKSSAGVLDKVVTSFSEDDVDALGDNIVLILNTVKAMTQPEIMGMLGRTISTVQEDEFAEPPSVLSLIKEMRDPQVRRGLARMLAMLRSMGEPANRASK